MTTPDDLVDDTDDPTPATSVAVDTLADPSDDPGSVDPDAESGAERGGFADDLVLIDDPDHRALAQDRPQHLGPSGADRPQQCRLPCLLGRDHREGVVDREP